MPDASNPPPPAALLIPSNGDAICTHGAEQSDVAAFGVVEGKSVLPAAAAAAAESATVAMIIFDNRILLGPIEVTLAAQTRRVFMGNAVAFPWAIT